MDYSKHLALSYYKTIATINESHHIYLVQHQDSGKIYIKKILSLYNAEIYQYLAEHPILGTPGIVDYFETDGQLILIEEYISGISLQEKISSKSLTSDKIIQYISNLCAILECLHEAVPPIVHRDIKPSNIIVTEYDKLILIDFNAAKYFTDINAEDTILLGTQGYAAPEQYGFGSSSPSTDIYSVGVLLRELAASLPDCDHRFDPIIERCTQINPQDRYHSAAELKASLSTKPARPPKSIHQTKVKNFLPPGYRTGTVWKMILASFGYICIFWISFSSNSTGLTGPALFVDQASTLLILLSPILCSFNYLDVQRFLPLCKFKNPVPRYLGIILLDFSVMFILIMLLYFINTSFLQA